MGTASITLTRVYLIETQPLMARAFCSVISRDPSLKLTGYATSAQRHRLLEARPDLILLDADHQPANLSAQIALCRHALPNARICLLASVPDVVTMVQSLSAGANGYIIKDISPRRLLSCLRTVTTGGFYADPRMSKMLVHRETQRMDPQLSPRETQVVRLIGNGLSNKEIGERLALSDKTVKNHVANIFSKLQLTARTQVAIYAIRSGIG